MTHTATPKRIDCLPAQGCQLPLAAEYSIANPMPATIAITSTKPQFSRSNFSGSRQARAIGAEEGMIRHGQAFPAVICATVNGLSGTRRAGSRRCTSRSTSRQIGAATAEPPPPVVPPCSTTVAQT